MLDSISVTNPSPSLPPGPRQPLISAIHWFRRPLEFLESASERYGDPFTMRLPGFPPLVMFKSPEAVKEVFRDGGEIYQAGRFYHALRPFLGEHSVLMLDGERHMRERKLLLPPFHGERMESHGSTMLALTDEAIDSWPLQRPLRMFRETQAVTLRVMARVIFGVDAGLIFDGLVRDLTQLTDFAAWPLLLVPLAQVDLGPWSPWGKFLRCKRRVVQTLLDQIQSRRSQGTVGRSDILSLLIEARDDCGVGFTDGELCDELLTLLFAGHETTATSLAWAVHWILACPTVQERLRSELPAAVGSDGRLVPRLVAKLEYLDCVVRESLRLTPAAPVVGRFLSAPAVVAGHSLPAGVAVLCSIYLAQRRPSAYPEPTRFNPDRFLGTKLSPSEFFPFGGGIRRCIGMAFALYEIKMVLATLMQRTRLRPHGPPVRVVRRITLKPSGDLPVVLEEKRPRPNARDSRG